MADQNMSQDSTQQMIDNFRQEVEKKGVATAPAKDGRIFMFKSEVLRRLILTTNSPDLRIGVRQADGTIKDVLLNRDRMQAELDATTQPYILVFLADGPIQN